MNCPYVYRLVASQLKHDGLHELAQQLCNAIDLDSSKAVRSNELKLMVDEVHNGSVQQRNLLEVTWTPHLDDLFLMLEMLDILALASTCKALFRLLALEICSAFWFKLKGQFVMYNPQNYSCVTSLENIDFSMAKRLSIARDFVLPEDSRLSQFRNSNIIFFGYEFEFNYWIAREDENVDVVRLLENLPTTLVALRYGFCGGDFPPIQLLPTITWLKLVGHTLACDHIPHSITHLTLGVTVIENLDRLPPTLTHLDIGLCTFNHHIDNLPQNLTHLRVGPAFNQKIDHLPASLIYLEISVWQFNQPIACLPENLQFLGIDAIRLPIAHIPIESLGNKLVYYSGCSTLGVSSNYFPESLKYLSFACDFDSYIGINLPPKLTHLIFGDNFNCLWHNLPQTLKILKFGAKFNLPLPALPESLEELVLGKDFKQPLYSFPPRLQSFSCFTLDLHCPFPCSLKRWIAFSSSAFLSLQPADLPLITHLHIGDVLRQTRELPPSVVHLSIESLASLECLHINNANVTDLMVGFAKPFDVVLRYSSIDKSIKIESGRLINVRVSNIVGTGPGTEVLWPEVLFVQYEEVNKHLDSFDDSFV